ncbi:hypothetical protein IX95_25895 [Vibrio sp. B183]|uniref:hypothetical protein n=1 Tax=Vibrio sp. B183 TaxID=1526762 RepID=UPI0005028649|nr:hypothetical protein [Vibrio sp. B183]KFI09152.1 hypothetical protein IX95_25895 [Vibrio sp. B183]
MKQQFNALITECFSKLGQLGIEIEGKEMLLEDLVVSDWQSKVLEWAASGRPLGVSFVANKELILEDLEQVLLPYGFTKEAALALLHSLRG